MKKTTNRERGSSTPLKEIKIDRADSPYLDLEKDGELEHYMMIKDVPFINAATTTLVS